MKVGKTMGLERKKIVKDTLKSAQKMEKNFKREWQMLK